MTAEQLVAEGQRDLAFAQKTLQDTGSLMQMFNVILNDGQREVIAFTGSNEEEAKDNMAKFIRARVAKGDVAAISMMSDVYVTVNATEQTEKLRRLLRMNVYEMGQAGLCEVTEAIFVSIETPLMSWIASQPYKRDAGKISSMEEPKIMFSLEGGEMRHSGRFAGYWPAATGVTQ